MDLREPISEHFRLTNIQKTALGKLGIKTLRDLLYHFPFRYEQAGSEASTGELQVGQEVTVVGILEKLTTKKSWKRRIPISDGYLRDQGGRVKLMWFNQPYIAKMYADGTRVKATGKVTGSPGKLYLANPQLEKISATEEGLFVQTGGNSADGGAPQGDGPRTEQFPSKEIVYPESAAVAEGLFAQYPESRGVTSLWFRHAIQKVLATGIIEQTEDPLPPDMLKRYNLPTLGSALVWMHIPEKLKDADAARKRFAFEEVFMIQLERGLERKKQSHEKSFAVDAPKQAVDDFIGTFPFTATGAQEKAIEAILHDMRSGHPMSRLLEGDVGSGKTAVAATAAYATVRTRPENQKFGTLQVAYMAPTEILAKQHFESFIKYFETFPINIGLITGSGCYKFPSKIGRGKSTTISRTQLLKWVAAGEIPVVIGTHALIQKSVQFKHLALVVIDEQHRFGTAQRQKLATKEKRLPHLLSMTATPIPRTLALTIYGDLDLTLLDEMPAGRKRIITEIVSPSGRPKAYTKIHEQLAEGRQAYVICPRIDEPDPDKAFALMAKSVTAEAKRLKKDVFQNYEIAILHSKMTPKEKDETMQKFAAHEIDILVATSVVEVGVNVPNATMIFIEGAERFGLAQLHQLRGRVVRSNHQAYCFVCPESRGEHTLARLKALATAKNGFELAEQDLLQRGPGELSGRKQWGISDIGMEALKNLKLVEAARTEALALVEQDENLLRHPLLQHALFARAQTLHFE
ncbi:MAG: ATP-dependent DNA helicase RecG [Candidatus Adlerbacteria bacterium]|nr:ATP-dependent DNA helicase RecG [Candidatus Adlerbacteria bacterium]